MNENEKIVLVSTQKIDELTTVCNRENIIGKTMVNVLAVVVVIVVDSRH